MIKATYQVVLALLIVLSPNLIKAQGTNLIINPSFEHFNDSNQIYLDTSSSNYPNVIGWRSAVYPTRTVIWSDYISRNQAGGTGLNRLFHKKRLLRFASGGSWHNSQFEIGKSFAQGTFITPLEKGCFYQLSYHILPVYTDYTGLPNYPTTWATDNRFGAYVSKEAIFDLDTTIRAFSKNHFNHDNYIPQVGLKPSQFITDTLNFTKIQGRFKAEGGEQHITFGNFYSLSNTFVYRFSDGAYLSGTSNNAADAWHAAWFLDLVELYKVAPKDSLLVTNFKDTNLCPNDSILYTANSLDPTVGVKWFDGDTATSKYISQPGTYWVEFNCGCDVTIWDTVVVSPADSLGTFQFGDVQLCPEEVYEIQLPTSIHATLNGNSAPNNQFLINQPGSYTLTLSNACYTKQYTFELTHYAVEPLPILPITDTSLCKGESFTIEVPAGFEYHLNSNLFHQTFFTINEQDEYSLQISNGCDSITYEFEVNNLGCEAKVFIPDAFTPNNDGINECFKISVQDYNTFKIYIYNRWGQLVYSSNNPDQCWDGTLSGLPAKSDVYAYTIVVNANGSDHTYQGHITLLR